MSRPAPFRLIQFVVASLLLHLACGGGGSSPIPPPAPVLASLAITPASGRITTGATANFTATGTYSDNSTTSLTTSVTWTSTQPGIASVGAHSGVVTGVSVGTATITATLGNITSPAITVTVNPPTLASIAITPSSASIQRGATASFTASGTYSDGSNADLTATATWTSAQPGIATVATSPGVVTGVAAGTASITASLDGITSPTATVNVTPPALTNLVVTPGTAAIGQGATASFTATGTYADSTTANLSTAVVWASSNTTVATISSSGVATGAGPGSSSITASLSGLTSNTASLTVTSGTLVSIAVTWQGDHLGIGSTLQLKATGTYSDYSVADLTALSVWSSSDPTVATIDAATGTATGLTEGQTGIVATAGGISSPVTPLRSFWNYTIRTLTLGGNIGGVTPYAINSAGQVVGAETVIDSAGLYHTHGLLYGNGAVTDLGEVHSNAPLYINASGQVAGTLPPAGTGHAFLYGSTGMVDLSTLGGLGSTAYGLSDGGTVTGISDLANGSLRAFTSQGSGMADLGVLTGTNDMYAVGISPAGQIIGWAQVPNSVATRAWIYGSGGLQDISFTADTANIPKAINATGQVAGNFTAPTGATHGFYFANGAKTDIGTLGAPFDPRYNGGPFTRVAAMNDLGQIVGVSQRTLNGAGGSIEIFLYTNGVMEDLGQTARDVEVVAINNKGQVVGSLDSSPDLPRAFIYSKGRRWLLKSLLQGANAADWLDLPYATAINDNGLIIGKGRLMSGEYRIFLLEPITGNP